MYQKCKSSLTIKYITYGIIIMGVTMVITSANSVLPLIGTNLKGFGILFLYFLFFGLMLILYLNRPNNIRLDEEKLQVRFPNKILSINLKEITEFRKAVKIPVFSYGSKGFFGFLGKSMDGSHCYITDPANTFYIKTKDAKSWYFSCENSDEFLSKLILSKSY